MEMEKMRDEAFSKNDKEKEARPSFQLPPGMSMLIEDGVEEDFEEEETKDTETPTERSSFNRPKPLAIDSQTYKPYEPN